MLPTLYRPVTGRVSAWLAQRIGDDTPANVEIVPDDSQVLEHTKVRITRLFDGRAEVTEQDWQLASALGDESDKARQRTEAIGVVKEAQEAEKRAIGKVNAEMRAEAHREDTKFRKERDTAGFMVKVLLRKEGHLDWAMLYRTMADRKEYRGLENAKAAANLLYADRIINLDPAPKPDDVRWKLTTHLLGFCQCDEPDPEKCPKDHQPVWPEWLAKRVGTVPEGVTVVADDPKLLEAAKVQIARSVDAGKVISASVVSGPQRRALEAEGLTPQEVAAPLIR